LANYLLCIGTVAVTAAYRNTTALGNAYGVCVMFVTFFDTSMTTLAALIVWRVRPYFVVVPWLVFACLDGAFLSSALLKVPDGAWFTLTLAAVLAAVLILWRFGKENQWIAEREDRQPLAHFVKADADGVFRLVGHQGGKGGEPISFTNGFGIFFDKGGINTPTAFSQFINKLVSTPEVIVFFHMRALEYPTVPADERFVVSQVKFMPNCYRVVCRHGYMDEIITPDLASIIYGKLRSYVLDKSRSSEVIQFPKPSPIHQAESDEDKYDADKKDEAEIDAQDTDMPSQLTLSRLQAAYEHRVSNMKDYLPMTAG
jgi:KUP system potassium uptake protein